MKVLEKTVELGEMSFKVRANRDIAVDTFQKYPDVLKYAIKHKGIASEEDIDVDMFLQLLTNNGLDELTNIRQQLSEMVAYALPIMLKSAHDTTNADDIIKYATENNALDVMNSGLLEFIAQGFTQGELANKPKIKFSMK